MDVRRKVLEAAIEIAASEGPDAVSMREVARRSEVSHQAPYHYFGDRAGIFAAIAEEGFCLLESAMSAVLSKQQHPAQLCLEAYVKMAREHPGHFRIMFRRDICGIDSHPSTLDAADRAYAALEEMVERTLDRTVSADEKTVWASVMWSVVHGFSTLLVDGPLEGKLPPGTDLEDHIQAVTALATAMVEAQAKKTVV